MNQVEKYNIYIYERYNDLKNSGKTEYDNYDLAKIFEYYTAIQLSNEYGRVFYEYNDISPDYKESLKMHKSDCGVDCSDMVNTIVQCKLRKEVLCWGELATFFASNIKKGLGFKWENYIVARNDDCRLSRNLQDIDWFTDKTYKKTEMIEYCEELLKYPPEYVDNIVDITLRDYQIECIDLINNEGNLVVCLPTGTGKNIIIVNSLNVGYKYLILVPRIILMDQLKTEIVKGGKFKDIDIQCIGDSNNFFDDSKYITICVNNSVAIVYDYCDQFEKIFVDEAHHVNVPDIYLNIDIDINNNNNDKKHKDDTYIRKIKKLSKFNNNVYMSATIDKINDFGYYKKDIREMIENGYLCDYTIHVPIFSGTTGNINICEYLIQNYRNIIIYCRSQEEGNEINKLLNILQPGSSNYIDAHTYKSTRKSILLNYKLGLTPFLVNVKVLIEGFDAPITRGVCLLHNTSSKTSLIQILGRALRLHPTKTYANIILPFSVNEDATNINHFIKMMATNDNRIKKAHLNKKLGGYINIDSNDNINSDNKDGCFRYEMVYNSLGNLRYNEQAWLIKFQNCKKYIDTFGILPTRKTEKNMSTWIYSNNGICKSRTHIMVIDKIYNIWSSFINEPPYNIHFLVGVQKWRNNKDDVSLFMDTYDRLPDPKSIDKKEVKMYNWIGTHKKAAKKKNELMVNETVYNEWLEFIEKYKKYITIYADDTWMQNFESLKRYIIEFKALPRSTDKNLKYRKLATWACRQKFKEFKDPHNFEKLWNDYINQDDVRHLFFKDDEEWKQNLILLDEYLKVNKEFPAKYRHHFNTWYRRNDQNYNNKKGLVWENEECKQLWETFKNQQQHIDFPVVIKRNREQDWESNLDKLISYIHVNKKFPLGFLSSPEDEKKLYGWSKKQHANYKINKGMFQYENIKCKWENFIRDLNETFEDHPLKL